VRAIRVEPEVRAEVEAVLREGESLTQSGGRMRQEMRTACALIARYHCGEIEPGTEITREQDRLIRLLATDLDVEIAGLEIGKIASQVARADKRWNQLTMAAVCEFYDRREQEVPEKLKLSALAFLAACPSA